MKFSLLFASVFFALVWSSVNLRPLLTHRPIEGENSTTSKQPEALSFLPSQPEFPRLPDRVDFCSRVAPIVQQRCMGCHPGKSLKTQAVVRAAELATLISTGDAGTHCLIGCAPPGDADVQPVGSRLTRAEFDLLRRWHEEGGVCPDSPPRLLSDRSDAERSHWAYQPLQPPPLPAVDRQHWSRNPIDAFILARLRQQHLTPAPSAAAGTLVRRLSLATIGLPPSPSDLERLQSATPHELDLYVDELLASPRYGEHWATFWLDLVRYADTNGYEDDGPKPLVWKYRDFVIRSFNDDRPYDEFVRMQIAGDLKRSPTSDDFVAVGFLRLGAWNSEPDDELTDRYHQLDDLVSTTGLVFLGMTIGCARCHDHPEEPITAVDYARLVGCFHGLGRPTQGRLEAAYASATQQQFAAAARTQQRQRQLRHQAFRAADESRAAALRKAAASLEEDVRFEQAYRLVETDVSHEPTRRLIRGTPHRPAELVKAGVPSLLAEKPFSGSELPRRQLAELLTTSQQALTARLIVNRVWAWHFGQGLVEIPSNFGLSGLPPTHPELLEWLADWFVNDAGWSLKSLHRLILTSQTCRTRVDLGNEQRQRLYGAFPRRRLRAEVLQDAMTKIAGVQDERLYGPPLPLETDVPDVTQPGGGPTIERGAVHPRRAIYQLVKRNAPNSFLATFDASDNATSCSQRRVTHTSQQALTLWNSSLVQACATSLADRILQQHPLAVSQQIDFAFSVSMGRLPDALEQAESHRFLELQTRTTGSAEIALSQLCLVLLNSDEFVFLD